MATVFTKARRPVKQTIRIAAWAAFWGDTRRAIRQVLDEPDLDYLVADHLAEITMALLARARQKDPAQGYIDEAVTVLAPLLSEIKDRGIKVITNAGALNPVACAQAIQGVAADAGLDLRVTAVEGDDLLGRIDTILPASDMFTGEPVPAGLSSLNAYLGATPIAEALRAGADVVVTGRCVDSAVVLAPLIHEFGWGAEAYDELSAGTLVGHLIECGPQVTGGLHTDWADVPGWDHMGYPIAECHADGTAVITKPHGTGGSVTPQTVAEQLVYEIGDPSAYIMPDVVCDWRDVTLSQDGPDRVRVAGARGGQPTATYKATGTALEGYRVVTTAMFAGVDAGGRARRTADAVIARTNRILAAEGMKPLTDVSIEVVGDPGTGAEYDRIGEVVQGVVLKLGVRHDDRAALELLATEYMPFGLIAQGMTGGFAGRPRVAPVFSVYHLLVDKSLVPVSLRTGDADPIAVPIAPGTARPADSDSVLPETPATPSDESAATVTVPLVRLALARSGDKGNKANIGLIARRPEYFDTIADQVTANRVREFFSAYDAGAVQRWALPGVNGINILIDDVLGGRGGTSSVRYDSQGKSYAAMLLALPIEVPAEWFHGSKADTQ